MLEYKTDVGAVDTILIHTVGAADMLRFAKRFTEVAAHEILVAQFSSKGSATEHPVEVAVEVGAEDIRAVVVERIFVGSVAEEFESVFTMIPIDGRFDMENAVFVLR